MRLLLFQGLHSRMRTIVYIDGFNLYHSILEKQPTYKWLNIKLLSEVILMPANIISNVNYYTARVSARFNPNGPRNQQLYLDALSTVPEISVYFGNFQIKNKYARMCDPPLKNPLFYPWPNNVRILKTEEKGSDVNLASHLLRDAFLDRFDVAAVITNDTDLLEPIRIVVKELSKPVGIISPIPSPANRLLAVASFHRFIRNGHLAQSQFPPVIHRNGKPPIVRPASWV